MIYGRLDHDAKLAAVKISVDARQIWLLSDLFKQVYKTRIARSSGINYQRLNRRLQAPEHFTEEEIDALARAFDIRADQMSQIIGNQVRENRRLNGVLKHS